MINNEIHKWPKKIRVDKRIVKILSEATYESFPNALREIIVNSYDADANKVEIKISGKNQTITINDNGGGMDESDFSFYLTIAAEKRRQKIKSQSGRYVVGQFGVGFVSIFPFFKQYEIETKKRGSEEVLYASIPSYKYFSDDELMDVGAIRIQGGIRVDRSKYSQSYTRIKLTGFTRLTRAYFFPEHDFTHRKYSILNYASMKKLVWRLAEDLPIRYESKKFDSIFKLYSPNLPFSVTINGEELFRNIYGGHILEKKLISPEKIGKISFRYFIATNKQSVHPYEARYLKIRNLNVGVGDRTNFGLGTEVGGARSRLHWLTGEIIISEGLNELLSVSRDNFNFDPDYERLKEFFIKKLAHYSSKLEDEAEIKRFINEKEGKSKISNLRLLNPDMLTKKIESLKESNLQVDELVNDLRNGKRSKKILIKNRYYTVKLDKWDYMTEFFPACKLSKNQVVINEQYPLFKKTKHTDLFIKLHIMLVYNLNDKTLNQKIYKKLVNEVLELYSDYFK